MALEFELLDEVGGRCPKSFPQTQQPQERKQSGRHEADEDGQVTGVEQVPNGGNDDEGQAAGDAHELPSQPPHLGGKQLCQVDIVKGLCEC